MGERMNNVFVYGTLRDPRVMARFVDGDVVFKETTLTNYARYPVLGASFPAIVEEEGKTVTGWLVEVSDEVLASFDRYEGTPHLYRREKVLTGLGEAFTYVFNQKEHVDFKGEYIAYIPEN